MRTNLSHVLNLVRHEADRNLPIDDPFPMTEARAQELIRSAALLVRRACLASPEMLTRITYREVLCQSRMALGECHGICEGNDEGQACPVRGSVESEVPGFFAAGGKR